VTDATHGQTTGDNSTFESLGARGIPAPAQPRFAAEHPPRVDAHSPASPYTVTATPRPARALPLDGAEPVAPVLPAPAVLAAEPVPQAMPVAPAMPLAPLAPVASEALTAPPAVVAEPPQPTPVVEPDDYIEPPIVPRPYAVPTQAYAPAPPIYMPASSPIQPSPAVPSAFTSSAPAPSPWAQGGGPSPYAGQPQVAGSPSADPYASFGGPDTTFGAPAVPSTPPGFGAAKPRTENVGRGLLLALVAVIGGCVLAAVVYHLGYVASIVSLAMGVAGVFLYSKGAGSPPRKGAVALVALLVAGILLAWVCQVATELYLYYVDRTGSSEGALQYAVTGALSLDLFKATLGDFLIYVAFGALGIFGVARQLLLPRKLASAPKK